MYKRPALAVIGALTLGCAQQPVVETGPDAEVTFDGLVRVDNVAMANAWVKPDIDLSSYDQFVVAPAEFEFRAVRDTRPGYRASSQSEFAISDSGKERLIKAVTDVFQDELAKSVHFTRAEAPGPGVLLIESALLDIVSRIPPDAPGRGDIYLDRVGEATIVLQLSDSISGETLARAADRRAAEPATGGLRSSPVTSIAEVRRLARRWASLLRRALDDLHERGRLDQPAPG